jgi:hypothetical protein
MKIGTPTKGKAVGATNPPPTLCSRRAGCAFDLPTLSRLTVLPRIMATLFHRAAGDDHRWIPLRRRHYGRPVIAVVLGYNAGLLRIDFKQ